MESVASWHESLSEPTVVAPLPIARRRRVGLAAADAFHSPLRRRPHGTGWRRTDQVVRQVLLADAP